MEVTATPSPPSGPFRSVDDEIAQFTSRTDLPSLGRWAHLEQDIQTRPPIRPPSLDPTSFDVDNPYAVEQWTNAWGIKDSEYLTLDGESLSKPREQGDDYLTLRQRQNLQWCRETIQTGNQYLKQKDFDRAIRAYNQAIEIFPESADAFVARGCAHANHGKYAEGVADLKRALKLDRDHVNAKKYLETILRDTGIQDMGVNKIREEAEQTNGQAAVKPQHSNQDFVFDEAELVGSGTKESSGKARRSKSKDRSDRKRKKEKKRKEKHSSSKRHNRDRRHDDRDDDRDRRKRHRRRLSDESGSEEDSLSDGDRDRRKSRSRDRDRARSRDRRDRSSRRSRHESRRHRDREDSDGDRHERKRRRDRRSRSPDDEVGAKRARSQSPARDRGVDMEKSKDSADEASVASSDYVPARPPSE